MAEIERLTPPDDLPDGGAPDHAPGTTSETASSRSANAASNYTGKEGIQALALRGMMGVDLTAIPTVGPGTALVIASEIGPDFSAFPLRPALLLLACARAGNQDQRRQEPPRQVPEGGQPRRAGPAHGGHGRAPQRDLHRRQAPRKARPNGHPRCDQGDRPRTRLPDLPHGDRRPRNTSSRASTPTRSGASTESSLISTAKPENSGLQLVPAPQNDETQNSMPSTA